MRFVLFGVLVALAVTSGGCSHFGLDRGDGWLSHLSGGLARMEPAPGSTKDDVAVLAPAAEPKLHHDSNWAPITKVRGGDWQDLIVTPVTSKGPHAVAHTDGPYLLDSGDQLRIFVYGQPNLSRIYTVDHVGNIMMPLIGLVRAQRRTAYQLAGVIRAQLGAKYVRDPQVTVDMHQNRPFFILGEVRTPGQYPDVNGMTIETAVAIAGGYTPRASTRGFRISRRVDRIVEVDNGTIDYVVQPGDTIKVRERFF